jgi:hypothetical protein
MTTISDANYFEDCDPVLGSQMSQSPNAGTRFGHVRRRLLDTWHGRASDVAVPPFFPKDKLGSGTCGVSFRGIIN